MSKQRRGPTLASAVERQSGACRTLAGLMRQDAEGRGVFDRKDQRMISGWAEALESIADALTLALADADAPALRRFGKGATLLAGALLGTAGGFVEGVGEGIFAEVFSERPAVQTCAQEVVDAGDAVVVRLAAAQQKSIRSSVPSPPPPAPRKSPRKITLHSLGVELGMTDGQMMTLAESMGVGVTSLRSSVIEAQADRIRRRAARDGLGRADSADALTTSE